MENNYSDIPHIDLTINENDLVKGATSLVKMIRINWPEDQLQCKIFNDGITNNLVGIWYPEHYDEMVLVRVYGYDTGLFIDRENEIRNIKILHKAGHTHSLYATFNNGFAYEFLRGATLTVESVRQPKIYKLVAKRMAQMHLLEPDIEKRPMIWDKLEKIMPYLPTSFSEEDKQKKLTEIMKSHNTLEKEYQLLKTELSCSDSPCIFAHNDLLLANILYNEEESSITYIDFEYTAYNYQAYDIANHFAEFVGVDNPDYSLYPEESLQKEWLKVYLETYLQRSDISEDEIMLLYKQVNQFVLLSHFFWGCWALIQSQRSRIDFDFLQYAAARFNEYFRRKGKF